MKMFRKYMFAGLVMSAFTACSFLDEDPQSFVGGEDYFQTETQCRSVVNSTYSQLRSVFSDTYWVILEGTSDIIYHPSVSNVNAIMELSPARCDISNKIWTPAYKMIMYANSAVEGIKSAPIDSLAKESLLAEAKIMRAFWYYQLTSNFGDVPFYFDDVKDKATMERIASLKRMPAVDTRATLIEDLRESLTYDQEGKYTGALPMNKASEITHGRAGWAMGEMLIAKMALWNACQDKTSGTDWYAVAMDALKHIESVYGDLNAYPLSDLHFRTKNTPEVIFEIQHTYDSGGLSYVEGLAAVCMPPYNRDTKLYDGVSVPELGHDAKVGTCSRPTLYFCAALQPDAGVDARATVNMAWGYLNPETGKTDPFKGTGTRPYMGPKFWCPNMNQTSDYNNYPVFRYADALLMMAECCLAKEDKAGFETYMNMVRGRAGLPAYTVTKWPKAKEELIMERARELFGEFQRKFDLVRWGIWYERVQEYSDFDKLKQTMKPCHEFLPIPDKQVIYSGYALDNNAYKEYGL
jgi:hypothetical protein